MSFLRKLFGSSSPARDERGIYLYVICDRCGDRLRLRIDREYDLNREGDGYTWHKTLVDNRCFRPMPTVVHFDRHYQVTSTEIEGGHYVSQEAYEAAGRKAAAEEEE